MGTHGRDVEGFVLHRQDEPDDNTVVQIIGRVDEKWRETVGMSFLIRLPDDSVTVAPAEDLTPWFAWTT